MTHKMHHDSHRAFPANDPLMRRRVGGITLKKVENIKCIEDFKKIILNAANALNVELYASDYQAAVARVKGIIEDPIQSKSFHEETLNEIIKRATDNGKWVQHSRS